MTSNFSYVRPESLRQAVDHLATKGARLHAGGTDLLGCLRDEVFGAAKVVSISGLEELQGGERLLNGQPLSQQRSPAQRQAMHVVFQDCASVP